MILSFGTDKKTLADAVSWAARRVPLKPESQILAGMLVEAREDGRLDFGGFDFDVSSVATVDPAGQWSGSGRIVVSGRLLDTLVKSLPIGQVDVTADDRQMVLLAGTVRCTLPLMPAADYPKLPESPEQVGRILSAVFAVQVGRVIDACDLAGETHLAALTGVHFTFTASGVQVAATNRFQLAAVSIPWETDMPESSRLESLVPGAVVADMLRAGPDGDYVGVGRTDGTVSFTGSGRSMVARTLGETFPPWAKLFPARSERPTVVQVAEVSDALKRAALVIDAKESVRLNFADGSLTMTAGSSDRAAVTAVMSCDHEGPDVDISVSSRYFATALAGAGETAELSITGPWKPVLVTAPDDTAWRHVVMPIRQPS